MEEQEDEEDAERIGGEQGAEVDGWADEPVDRAAAKSAASGTTNQIFAPAARRAAAHCCFLYAKQG